MPSGSLLDMDGFVRNVVGMQNLDETRRRNDIYEKNSLLQAEQNKIDQQKLKQNTAFRAFDELGKMADHPALATNLDKQADLLLMQGQVMATGLGVKVPLPSKDELLGGFEQTKTLMRAMRSGDQEKASGALMDAMTANPKWARTVLDDMKKAGDLTTQMQELDLRLQTHRSQLEAINVKTGRIKMQQGLFTEHAAGLTRVTNLGGDPKFARQFQEVLSFQKPEARQAYLNLPENQAFKQAFEQQIEAEKKDMGFFDSLGKEAEGLQPQKVHLLEQDVMARSAALADAQAKSPDGQAPQEQAEDLKGYNAVWKARQVEAEWLKDPYNKDKWKALKKAEQDLKILQGGTTKKLTDLGDQRLALAQSKFDLKTQTGLAESDLQNEFIKGITHGKADSQSLGDAIAVVKQKYPGVPFDATKIENPDKKGKQTITLLSPTERTNIAEERTLVGQLDKIIESYDPNYVGMFDSRVGDVGQMTSTLSAKREMWLQESRAFLAEARHKIFGASLTGSEKEAALSELPNERMGDKQWPAAAKAWRDKWGNLIEQRLRVAGQARTPNGQPTRPQVDLKGMSEQELMSVILGGGQP